MISAGFGHEANFNTLGTIGLILWPIALLIMLVRAAGLVAAEKARQTLDVLLTTPLSASELIGAKMRGLRRTMAIVAVPIIFQTLLIAFLRLAVGQLQPYSGREDGRQILGTGREALLYLFVIGLNLVILFKLAAELAFLFGLYAKTQARAVTFAVSVFVAMCFLPVMVRISIRENWAGDVLYLSPIADILVSEFPWLGVEWGRYRRSGWVPDRTAEWQFYPLLHCALYAVIVVVLAGVNRRLAAEVLLRPKRQRTSSRPCVACRRWPIRRPQSEACATPETGAVTAHSKRRGNWRSSPTAELWYAPLSDYSTRVKGAHGGEDFSVVVSLFLRRRKTRKIGDLCKNCSAARAGHLVKATQIGSGYRRTTGFNRRDGGRSRERRHGRGIVFHRGRVTRVEPRVADLPTAAHGAIGLDQALTDFAAGLGERVLLQHEVLLELSDAGEVDGSRLVLHESQGDGFLGLIDATDCSRVRIGHVEM